mgnify:CR=1 FL=1
MNKLSPSQVEKLKEIGTLLRTRRQELSISLEQLESRTQIRLRLLRAIEAGQAEQLPEPIYVMGFIRLYGNALQLDGEALAKTFLQEAPAATNSKNQDLPPEKTLRRPISLPKPRGLGIYVFYLLVLMGAVWGLFYLLNRSPANKSVIKDTPSPTVNLPSPTPTSTPLAKPKAPAKAAPLSITVSLEGSSWLRVKGDGTTLFEGTLSKGTQKTWKAQKQLTITAGNAGAVKLSKNQEPAKLIGRPGEVKEITLTSTPSTRSQP